MLTKSYAKIIMALSQLAMLAAAGPLEKRQQTATLSVFSQDGCQGDSSFSVQIDQQNSCVELTGNEDAQSYSFDASGATLSLFTGGGCGQMINSVSNEGSSGPICAASSTQVTGVQWHSN